MECLIGCTKVCETQILARLNLILVLNHLISEEILHTNTALWLSNDGHLMLYAVFNDSAVLEQKYTWYGTNNGKMNLYPEVKSLR